jgi:mannose-6-phosphate isomerase-like protein (cupin superfamily)
MVQPGWRGPSGDTPTKHVQESAVTDTAARQASVACFDKIDPQETDAAGTRTWITRGGNFVVAVSRVKPGATLARADNADEYMVILPPGMKATIKAGNEEIEASDDSLTIVPPGPSVVTARGEGLIARIITSQAKDLLDKAWNAATYADGAPEVAPVQPWPDPVDGFKLRHYPLAPYYDPKGDRIQPRLFRSTNMMVNLFAHYHTRRDTAALSPHWHEDFEQASLTLDGTWVHHMRWPWNANLAEWRPDNHDEIPTPSVIIIPANVVHTSRDIGAGVSSLYDIFCPPRLDFASKPGFVINEKEYPMPETDGSKIVTKGTLLAWQKSA